VLYTVFRKKSFALQHVSNTTKTVQKTFATLVAFKLYTQY